MTSSTEIGERAEDIFEDVRDGVGLYSHAFY